MPRTKNCTMAYFIHLQNIRNVAAIIIVSSKNEHDLLNCCVLHCYYMFDSKTFSCSGNFKHDSDNNLLFVRYIKFSTIKQACKSLVGTLHYLFKLCNISLYFLMLHYIPFVELC